MTKERENFQRVIRKRLTVSKRVIRGLGLLFMSIERQGGRGSRRGNGHVGIKNMPRPEEKKHPCKSGEAGNPDWHLGYRF